MDSLFLTLRNLTFSYPGAASPVFSALNLHFSQGWTAITGPNGSGKTTLLRLVCGLLKPDSGALSAGGASLASSLYCPQQSDVMPLGWETAFAGPESGKTLALLRIGDDWLFRFDSLSGGEKKRLQLAAALCMLPPVLALDEPTNHLDAQTRGLIISALKEYDGIGLAVSHDRELMDSLCKATLYLGPGETRIYPGGVSAAMELRDADRKARTAEWNIAKTALQKEKALVQREAEDVSRTKKRLSLAKIPRNDHDTKRKIKLAILSGKDAIGSRRKKLANTRAARAEQTLNALDKPLLRKQGVTISAERTRRDIICRVPPGSIIAGEYILTIPELTITPDSRIGLVGENGAGKTLAVRRVIAELESAGRDTTVFYLPQEIPEEAMKSRLAAFNALEKAKKAQVLSNLYRLGSEPERVNARRTAALSPGEMRKLMLAQALCGDIEAIIMDEPTNFMDFPSLQILESALKSCNCPLLLVSHDRAFLGALTRETWTVERQGNQGRMSITGESP